MTTDSALYPAERLAARRGRRPRRPALTSLLLTPGPDLRYVTGYDAKQLERLTCLAVPADGEPFLLVPQLELKAAQASPAGALDVEIVTWGETAHPFGMIQSHGRRPAVDRPVGPHVGAARTAVRGRLPERQPAAGEHGAVAAADPQVGRRGRRAA